MRHPQLNPKHPKHRHSTQELLSNNAQHNIHISQDIFTLNRGHIYIHSSHIDPFSLDMRWQPNVEEKIH